MNRLNKILLLAQIIMIVGSALVAYRVVDFIDLRQREEMSNVVFNSIHNEFENLLLDSKDTLTSWAKNTDLNKNKSSYCNNPIIKTLDSDPLYLNYGVLALDGSAICSKVEFPKGYNVNNSTPRFKQLIEEKEFVVTSFGLSKVSKEPRIGVGLPLLDKQGNVVAGLFLSIRLENVNNYIANLDLPAGSEVLITDPEGLIEVIYPLNSDLLGQKKFSATTYSLILSQKEGQVRYIDEQKRNMVYTYHPLEINNDQDKIGFMLYGIERRKNIVQIPDSLTIAQLTLLLTSIIMLGFVAYKQTFRKEVTVQK